MFTNRRFDNMEIISIVRSTPVFQMFVIMGILIQEMSVKYLSLGFIL